jgi:hypothetical protein
MSKVFATTVVALVLLTPPGFAQFGGMGGMGGKSTVPPSSPRECTVKVETIGGQSLSGTLTLTWVPVECDFGLYRLKPEKVKAIRFVHSPDSSVVGRGDGLYVKGVVTTTSGEEIRGSVVVSDWTVMTELGVVTLDPTHLTSLSFQEKGEEPAKKS